MWANNFVLTGSISQPAEMNLAITTPEDEIKIKAAISTTAFVRSITIDYDQAPIIILVPDRSILQNFTSEHFLNLSYYIYDYECSAQQLTYQITSVSDSRCGVSLDSHWVNANPQLNWIGSCYVTIRVNDSIKTATTGFWLQVLQINSRISLPVIMSD
jgi:hypothetical protein